MFRTVADEEDVALSAFGSFCRGVEQGPGQHGPELDALVRQTGATGPGAVDGADHGRHRGPEPAQRPGRDGHRGGRRAGPGPHNFKERGPPISVVVCLIIF